jgi:hypothetical protein
MSFVALHHIFWVVCTGIVIGKGGENIRALQLKTGARIQMAKDQNMPERDVTITGSPQQIEAAKYEINALIGQVVRAPRPLTPTCRHPPSFGLLRAV